MKNLYLLNITNTPVKQEVPPLLGQNDNPAAKKSNLFKINKNKKYVLQHKIEDNRIKKHPDTFYS